MRPLLQAGQISVKPSTGELDGVVVNLIETSVLSARGWLSEGEEAGHSGKSFVGRSGELWLFDGVNEGTQNDGSVGFEA